jgi:hypothetical protein
MRYGSVIKVIRISKQTKTKPIVDKLKLEITTRKEVNLYTNLSRGRRNSRN